MANELLIMAANNDGRPLSVNLLKNADDFKSEFGVQIARRLIRQKNLRVVHHSPGYGHALLFSVGEVGRILPHLLMEINQPQGVENSAADFLNRDSENMEADGNIVKDFFMEEKAEVLENDAHRPPQPVDLVVGKTQDINAVDDDLAPSRQDLTENDFEESRFSRAARPGDKPKVSSFNVEADIEQGPLAFLVLFPDVIEFYHRCTRLL